MNPIRPEEIDEPLPEPPPIPESNRAYPGDCLATMQAWPGEIADCIVTSPPYFDQRSYLPAAHPSKGLEIGHGRTLDEYLDAMTRVFREARRLLAHHGLLWLNIGDTYDSCKNLMGVPWRLAFRLQDDGWILRQCVIWEKPNVLPAPADDRPTTSHEYVFQFARSMRPYFDWYAAREIAPPKKARKPRDEGGDRRPRSVWSIPTVSLNGRKLMADFKDEAGVYREIDPSCLYHGGDQAAGPLFLTDDTPACCCKPIEADFFAAMPPALAARCIALSTSDVGNCSLCGAPYRRVLHKERVATRPGRDAKADASGQSHKDPGRHITRVTEGGWTATCDCVRRDAEADRKRQAAVVFDPFLGSGTTAVAATLLDRRWIGCELNEMLVDRLIPARLRAAAKGGRRGFPEVHESHPGKHGEPSWRDGRRTRSPGRRPS